MMTAAFAGPVSQFPPVPCLQGQAPGGGKGHARLGDGGPAIRAVVNPGKLRHIGPASGVARLPEQEVTATPPSGGNR